MLQGGKRSKRRFLLNHQYPFEPPEEDVFNLSNVGYQNSVVIGTAVLNLAVFFKNSKTASDEAFDGGYDVEGVAGDGESVG